MSLETELAANTAALKDNTTALNAVLAAGGAAPTNVIPITETPKPAAAPKGKAKAAATPAPEPEPEKPTKVEVAASESDEFADPLDPETTVVVPASEPIDADAVIVEITTAWKEKLAEADAERKALLKDKFPELRAKWGLAADAKLISLAGTPEKLVGLLNDIKAL